MTSFKVKRITYKFFSLLSVIRGYNILVLVAAQYLAAIFIFSPQKIPRNIVLDVDLFYIVFATVCVVASGYIINNFYDVKVDRINRPLKSNLDNYVKQSTRLKLYFFLNFLGFFFGWLISWRAALFFGVYIFAIWFYSHKLKKYPLTGLISATVLTILPFFTVFIYFKNFSKIIFVHAIFLFLVTLFPAGFLLQYPALGYMQYYFYLALITLIFVGFYLWKSTERNQYIMLHNILKLLLLVGVLSLVFIDTSLIVEKVIHRLN